VPFHRHLHSDRTRKPKQRFRSAYAEAENHVLTGALAIPAHATSMRRDSPETAKPLLVIPHEANKRPRPGRYALGARAIPWEQSALLLVVPVLDARSPSCS